MKRFLVLTMRTPAFDSTQIGAHHAFLDRLRDRGRIELAGPFSDRSGGAYLLNAAGMADATAIAHEDPLHLSGSSRITLYEWDAR